MPDEYRTWVRSVIWACLVGYSITAIAVAVETPELGVLQNRQLYTVLAAAFGLLLVKRERPMEAAYLVLFAVAVETCIAFYLASEGIRAAALPALPVIVMGSGLFLGPRAGYGFALGTGVLVPLLVWLSGEVGVGPGLGAYDIVYIAALWVCQLATAFVLHVFLRSFGYMLACSQANERRAADLLEAASDGLVVVAPNGTIEASNGQAARALGISREDLVGVSAETLPLAPVDHDSGKFELSDLTEQGNPVEYLSKATGLAVEARARRVASGDERASWLILLRDVTARIEGAKRERELASQLQHSRKLEAIGQLAGGIAHDFNNLLTVVAGCADFIDDLHDDGAEEIADELRATYQSGVVLTRQLLAFARREVVTPVPVDVAATIHGLVKLLKRVVGEQVRLEIIADELCPIVADPGQLEQVVMNLVSNARDAMPEGGSLAIRVYGSSDRVVLEVTDTGVGIDQEVQKLIFDPFFTTKPRGKGTGLGLATVHGIVTQSDGEISVDSRLGEGACFKISWPRTWLPLPGRTNLSHAAQRQKGQGLILLAEDDVHARKLIVRMLEEAGFDVLVAQDGAEALSLAVNLDRCPDLLLTDIVMPGISGVELIERVQRLYPRLDFLLMSGYTDQQLAPAQFDLTRDLIHKPFGRAELLEMVFSKLPVVRRKLA